jgi:dTDP-4-amino-4,6-dideoxygalactose transaminase
VGRRKHAAYVPFHVPWTDGREIAGAARSIRSGWLTTGPMVGRFQEVIRRMAGARYAVAVNSCTAALHLALAARGIGRGDEVITSPYTFAATGEAILYLGARPVFADIDPATLNLDPEAAARAVTRRTRAIVPVHIAGLPCDMAAIGALARRRRLAVIDDAAHALGAAVGKRPIGSIADLTCFSFYATKNLTTGEGGMITTDDRRAAERARLLSLHGLSRDAWRRYTRGGSWRYDVVDLGFKYNLTDLAAAVGLAQAAKFPAMQAMRRRMARRYTMALRDCDAFDLPVEVPGTTHAWHLYVLRLRPGRLRVDRDRVIDLLRARGVGTSVHFLPLHLFSFYRKTFGHRPGDYPHTERQSARALSLPLYPGLRPAAQERVIDALLEIARRYRR